MRLCKVCGTPASEWEPYLLCAEHLRDYRRQFNLRRRGKNADLTRRRYAANPGPAKAASKAWYHANKVRMWLAQGAGRYVSWAVATGLLTKPDRCQRCGFRGYVEAAHADYGKPLDVEWLCRSCHRLWDRTNPKTMPKLGMVVFDQPEPSPNGDRDDGQEPGLEGGTKDGDGPGLE